MRRPSPLSRDARPALSPQSEIFPPAIPRRSEISRAHARASNTSWSAAGWGNSGESRYSGAITAKSRARSEQTFSQVSIAPIVQPPPWRYITAGFGFRAPELYTLTLMRPPPRSGALSSKNSAPEIFSEFAILWARTRFSIRGFPFAASEMARAMSSPPRFGNFSRNAATSGFSGHSDGASAEKYSSLPIFPPIDRQARPLKNGRAAFRFCRNPFARFRRNFIPFQFVIPQPPARRRNPRRIYRRPLRRLCGRCL